MKFIDGKDHDYIDYLMKILLIVAPSVFDLDRESVERIIFYILGISLLLYSTLSNIKLGLIK
ncbi:MAG: hypothetical protein V4572_05795 [Bacteroidota bacterium]